MLSWLHNCQIRYFCGQEHHVKYFEVNIIHYCVIFTVCYWSLWGPKHCLPVLNIMCYAGHILGEPDLALCCTGSIVCLAWWTFGTSHSNETHMPCMASMHGLHYKVGVWIEHTEKKQNKYVYVSVSKSWRSPPQCKSCYFLSLILHFVVHWHGKEWH